MSTSSYREDDERVVRLMAEVKRLRACTRFLLDRLDDFEGEIESDELAREWSGHVSPAIARLRDMTVDQQQSAPAAFIEAKKERDDGWPDRE